MQPTPEHFNEFGQPIGRPLADWSPRPRPPRTPLIGRLCRLDALDADLHAKKLHDAYAQDPDGRNWTYLPYGPFESADAYAGSVRSVQAVDDPIFYAIVDLASSDPVGVASFLRIDPAIGTIEVGHLRFAPALQRTAAATEAMYLMMRRAFEELGYRRYEWKCDGLNLPSRKAAERLGFTYEGTFRNAMVTKGRNRDTAWYAITDDEWPARKQRLERWLDPSNFDADGKQRTRLADRIE
jgi:RimJ/RimL family protein N-acetyltransferase